MAIEEWDESPVRLKQHLLDLEARVAAGEAALMALTHKVASAGLAEVVKNPGPIAPPPPPPPAPKAPRDPDPGAVLA